MKKHKDFYFWLGIAALFLHGFNGNDHLLVAAAIFLMGSEILEAINGKIR